VRAIRFVRTDDAIDPSQFFHNDTWLDICAVYHLSDQVVCFANQGLVGGVVVFAVLGAYSVGSSPVGIAVLSNYSSFPAVVVTNYADGTVTMLLNANGTGLNQSLTYSAGANGSNVAAADVRLGVFVCPRVIVLT
jgi:hypothetical protein